MAKQAVGHTKASEEVVKDTEKGGFPHNLGGKQAIHGENWGDCQNDDAEPVELSPKVLPCYGREWLCVPQGVCDVVFWYRAVRIGGQL
jgi:hypothetical protein